MAEAVLVLSQIKSRKVVQPTCTHENNDDEHESFAKYLSLQLKKVKDPRINNQLKLKIQSLIFDAQFEDSNPPQGPLSGQQQMTQYPYRSPTFSPGSQNVFSVPASTGSYSYSNQQ